MQHLLSLLFNMHKCGLSTKHFLIIICNYTLGQKQLDIVVNIDICSLNHELYVSFNKPLIHGHIIKV